MITLHIHYSNKTEYQPLESYWAANLIAIDAMRKNSQIESIYIVDNNTGEVLKTFERE